MSSMQTKQDGNEITRWTPFPEPFLWNTRVGQLFDTMWHSAMRGEGFPPSAELRRRGSS